MVTFAAYRQRFLAYEIDTGGGGYGQIVPLDPPMSRSTEDKKWTKNSITDGRVYEPHPKIANPIGAVSMSMCQCQCQCQSRFLAWLK